jgi:hypothetical protein
MKRLAARTGVRPLFENSTVCLKIDAKNPVLMGQASWGFGLVVVVSDGFSFGCEIVAFLLLTGSVLGGSMFYSQRSIWLGGCLIPGAYRVSFEIACIQWPFGVVDKTSTESLILAQDERWRRA